jgi:Protein of unknown function (DUF2380)
MHARRTLMATLACLSLAAGVRAQTIAITGFDYTDTSGEVRDQRAEHATRLTDFLHTLQTELAGKESRALILGCAPACTARDTASDVLLASARDAGATMLVYGGIHKVSTLIQEAVVQMVDVEQDRLVVDRRISFRGDTDDAWRRAAAFAATSLRAASETK